MEILKKPVEAIRQFYARKKEEARVARVTAHPHTADCTRSGDITYRFEQGKDYSEEVRTSTCTECHVEESKTYYVPPVLISGGW